MAYAFLRANKLKTREHFIKSMEHNFRLTEVANAEPEKRHLNKELIKLETEDYLSAYAKKVNESPVYQRSKVRSDAVRALEVLLTCAGETNEKLFDQDRWEQKNIEWLQNKFGAENVVSAMVHYDESSPHIHAIVIPMVNGRLNAKSYLPGRGSCSKLQTEYHEAMKEFGLERGLERTGATHTEIKRFQSAVKKACSRELPYVEVGETAHEYRERANEYHKDSHLHGIDALEKEKRNTQKAKSALAKTKDELKLAYDELALLRAEKKEWDRATRTKEMKAERMDELLCGLENGSLSPEDREIFESTMERIYEGERKRRVEEMTVEKKAFLMDELLVGIESGSLPAEEREVFKEYMKAIVAWERERRANEHIDEITSENPSDDDR